MKIIQKISNNFTTLNAQYLINKNRNAMRFEAQNINWNFEQVNYQASALIKGLTSMKFKSSDNFLIKLPANQQTQTLITKVGTVGLGAKLFVSKATTAGEFDKQILQNNISCLFFQPSLVLQNKKLIDTLNSLAPQLPEHLLGSPLKLSHYPSLRCLIQTNFYSYPGVYKFRAILNYASDKNFNVEPVNVQPIPLDGNNPIVITDSAHDFAFRAGVLNSITNGRYLHVVEQAHAARLCSEVYNNKVDFIATSETSLDPAVRVIVEKGSNLFAGHQNRLEL